MSAIVPHLIVSDGARAIAFYREALGAELVDQYTDARLGGVIVHAKLRVGDAAFTIAAEHREWHNSSPATLGGSPVVLMLVVDDADAVGNRLERAGAKVVFPIVDQFFGKRQGRFVDPFGHLWIVSQTLVELSAEEIQRRIDAGLAGS